MPDRMDLPVRRWLDKIPERHSRRAFEARALAADDATALASMCETFRPFGDARVVFVGDAPESVFTGIVGSYGKVKGAPSAFVFLADAASPTAAEHCGYTGEAFVLEACARGLETCWIGGSFSRPVAKGLVDLGDGEEVRAVSPVGHALTEPSNAERWFFGAAREKHRRPIDEIAPGAGSWPEWAQAAVAAVRVAPSAMNRQPWRFREDGGSIVLSVAGGSLPRLARLDCGIAMLHFELGARGSGCDGTWETLDAPDVARWVPAA
jgi:nitroreductase